MVMKGILLKALRDTASISYEDQACYRYFVRQLPGKCRVNVSELDNFRTPSTQASVS